MINFLVSNTHICWTKKLIIAYSFSFGDTSYEVPKNAPKWKLQRDILWTSSARRFKHLP